MSNRVLILGAGEHATGTAHRLFRCGFRVTMTELAEPRAVRRTVSFCTAVVEGAITVEGVTARRWDLDRAPKLDRFSWDHVPVFVDPQASLREHWRPEVIIDARILKRNAGNHPGMAPLVIGYGPGLCAGRDVHVVVETNRGHDLGRLVTDGLAEPDTGVPGPVGGHGAARILRAPARGVFQTDLDIGDRVEAGQVVARVAGVPLKSRIGGVLRGLIQPGIAVEQGLKVGDVDPRGVAAFSHRLSDKTRTISGGALEAILVARHQGRLPS